MHTLLDLIGRWHYRYSLWREARGQLDYEEEDYPHWGTW